MVLNKVLIKWFFVDRSARESAENDTVGYVQIRGESGVCTLKCKICHENKVSTGNYNLTMLVNENKSKIVSCEGLDCEASTGWCKYSVILFWCGLFREVKNLRSSVIGRRACCHHFLRILYFIVVIFVHYLYILFLRNRKK